MGDRKAPTPAPGGEIKPPPPPAPPAKQGGEVLPQHEFVRKQVSTPPSASAAEHDVAPDHLQHGIDLVSVRALRSVVWANLGREARGCVSAAEIAQVVHCFLANLRQEGLLAAPSDADVPRASGAVADIANERARQVAVEGYDASHDDAHDMGELALAAIHYAAPYAVYQLKREYHRGEPDPSGYTFREVGPWPCELKKHPRRRQLVIAGALIVAEIERLDRAVAAECESVRDA